MFLWGAKVEHGQTSISTGAHVPNERPRRSLIRWDVSSRNMAISRLVGAFRRGWFMEEKGFELAEDDLRPFTEFHSVIQVPRPFETIGG